MPIDRNLASALGLSPPAIAADEERVFCAFRDEVRDRGSFLSVPSCHIESIEGLDAVGCDLRALLLVDNKVADIRPLAALTQLAYLDLRNNPVREFTHLGGLTNLRTLYLTLPTKGLCLNFLRPLKNLRTLWIEGTGGQLEGIDNIRAIAQLTELRTLALNCCKLDDNTITELGNCAKSCENLRGLWLRDNAIQTPQIGTLQSLTHVDLSHNQIATVVPLEKLTHVRGLWLSNNKTLRDITPLTKLRNLRGLWAAQLGGLSTRNGRATNNIPSQIAELARLTHLDLSNNRISDIGHLSQLTNLTGLWLANNWITDIDPLVALKNIRGLWLSGNQIKKLSANKTEKLQLSWSNLRTLDLGNNNIRELAPFATLEQLSELGLAGNNITAVAYKCLPDAVAVDPPGIAASLSALQLDEKESSDSTGEAATDPPGRECDNPGEETCQDALVNSLLSIDEGVELGKLNDDQVDAFTSTIGLAFGQAEVSLILKRIDLDAEPEADEKMDSPEPMSDAERWSRMCAQMEALRQVLKGAEPRYRSAVFRWIVFCFATQQPLSWVADIFKKKRRYFRLIDLNRLRWPVRGRTFRPSDEGITRANAAMMSRAGEELVAALSNLEPARCGTVIRRALGDEGCQQAAECFRHRSYIDGRLTDAVRLCCVFWQHWIR